ncbi:hypothetical protein PENSPDRAFT_682371 [Peniophora sp. CONT]|nr:hypothetical protein PENSPDRAFT_682371 [Peniophora sp. CONT]
MSDVLQSNVYTTSECGTWDEAISDSLPPTSLNAKEYATPTNSSFYSGAPQAYGNMWSSTGDTPGTIAGANVQTFLPTLLSRIGQLVWPLSLPPPPRDVMPIVYSAILPFALQNTDEITVFSNPECGEPSSEREYRFREWVRTQDQAAAYNHWLPRGEETCAVRLQALKSRSRARQAAYMQRRNRRPSLLSASVRVRSPLRLTVEDHPTERSTQTGETGHDDGTNLLSGDFDDGDSDSSWGEEWDESLSLPSEDCEELGQGGYESASWREKPMPLDERYSLIYGPSVVFGPCAASLMGYPESSWALWLPSENDDNLDATTDVDADIMSTLDIAKAMSVPKPGWQDTKRDTVVSSTNQHTHLEPVHIRNRLVAHPHAHPLCATRLAARAHSGRLLKRQRPSAQTRAAATSHLKLAAWVLTTVKLDEDEAPGLFGVAEEYGNGVASVDYEGQSDGSSVQDLAKLVLSLKRAREEDSQEDENVDHLQSDARRPVKRVHL